MKGKSFFLARIHDLRSDLVMQYKITPSIFFKGTLHLVHGFVKFCLLIATLGLVLGLVLGMVTLGFHLATGGHL